MFTLKRKYLDCFIIIPYIRISINIYTDKPWHINDSVYLDNECNLAVFGY